MLGRIAAGCTLLALAGCAYITGPCKAEGTAGADGTTSRSASCEATGTMILMPAPKLDQLQPR